MQTLLRANIRPVEVERHFLCWNESKNVSVSGPNTVRERYGTLWKVNKIKPHPTSDEILFVSILQKMELS